MPNHSERTSILEVQLSKVKHAITPDQICYITRLMEGYSGADLVQVVKKANMAPVEKVKSAKHFTLIPIPLRCLKKKRCKLWHPCHSSAPGAEALTEDDLDKTTICLPSITWIDLLDAIECTPKSVDPKDLQKYCKFGQNFGIKVDEPLAVDPESSDSGTNRPSAQTESDDSTNLLYSLFRAFTTGSI